MATKHYKPYISFLDKGLEKSKKKTMIKIDA